MNETSGYASTGEVARELVRRVGEPEAGFQVRDFQVGHHAALVQAGPGFLRHAVEALLET